VENKNYVYIEKILDGKKTEIYAKPIPPGLYTLEKVVSEINKIKEVHDCATFRVNYKHDKHKRLEIRSKATNYTIYFSRLLSNLLGVRGDEKFQGSQIVANSAEENLCLADFIYLYSDIITPQLVGDVVVPLLRIIQIDKEKYVGGSRTRIEFENPHYVPVEKYEFSTIEMYLFDDKGVLIPFEHGTSCIKLHFRKLRDEQ